jgi:hypothetical protein
VRTCERVLTRVGTIVATGVFGDKRAKAREKTSKRLSKRGVGTDTVSVY